MASLFWETSARLFSQLKLKDHNDIDVVSFHANVETLSLNYTGRNDDTARPGGLCAFSHRLAATVASIAYGISRGSV